MPDLNLNEEGDEGGDEYYDEEEEDYDYEDEYDERGKKISAAKPPLHPKQSA
jgi:hypothetical protein